MREIDFLPKWYPAIQQRIRALMLQAWVSLVIVAVVIGFAMNKRSQVRVARQITTQTESQMTLSRLQLAKLNNRLKYKGELREEDQMLARLGLNIETTRLLVGLQDAMPEKIALTNLSLETTEQTSPGDNHPADVDRQLKVLVSGIAPTDVESAAFVDRLLRLKCFDNVALSYLRPGRNTDGHAIREFEIRFEMNLNPPMEGSDSLEAAAR